MVGKSIEIQHKLVTARQWGGRQGGVTANDYGISLWSNANILESDSDDDCTISFIPIFKIYQKKKEKQN